MPNFYDRFYRLPAAAVASAERFQVVFTVLDNHNASNKKIGFIDKKLSYRIVGNLRSQIDTSRRKRSAA
jgi:hypothetical protein